MLLTTRLTNRAELTHRSTHVCLLGNSLQGRSRMVMKHMLSYMSTATRKQLHSQEVSKLLWKISVIGLQACKLQLKLFFVIIVVDQLGL